MKLAITGRGLISSVSTDPTEIPDSSLNRDKRFDDFDPTKWLGKKGHRNCDRLTKMMIAAAGNALTDSGIKKDGDFVAFSAERVGICSATAFGSLDSINELNRVAELENPRYINPARFPNTVINAAAGYVSIWENLQGPNVTLVNGNCGSMDSFYAADTHLRAGRADAFVVGGGEVITDSLLLAMRRLGLKDSFHLGEGAAYLVVERSEEARKRNATIFAHCVGYGSAYGAPGSDAVLIHPSVTAYEAAVEQALREANLSADQIDLVLRDACGIEAYDRVEREALEKLGLDDVPSLYTKKVFGDSFGASGAFATVFGLESSGADKTTLIVSLGHYGNASAILLQT